LVRILKQAWANMGFVLSYSLNLYSYIRCLVFLHMLPFSILKFFFFRLFWFKRV
jgi:hypothetical protein